MTLAPNELLLLYTDGVTEASNLSGEEFGPERLAQSVKAASHLNAKDLIAAVQKEVIEWTEGLGATDDITFFVIKAVPKIEAGDEDIKSPSPVSISRGSS